MCPRLKSPSAAPAGRPLPPATPAACRPSSPSTHPAPVRAPSWTSSKRRCANFGKHHGIGSAGPSVLPPGLTELHEVSEAGGLLPPQRAQSAPLPINALLTASVLLFDDLALGIARGIGPGPP